MGLVVAEHPPCELAQEAVVPRDGRRQLQLVEVEALGVLVNHADDLLGKLLVPVPLALAGPHPGLAGLHVVTRHVAVLALAVLVAGGAGRRQPRILCRGAIAAGLWGPGL